MILEYLDAMEKRNAAAPASFPKENVNRFPSPAYQSSQIQNMRLQQQIVNQDLRVNAPGIVSLLQKTKHNGRIEVNTATSALQSSEQNSVNLIRQPHPYVYHNQQVVFVRPMGASNGTAPSNGPSTFSNSVYESQPMVPAIIRNSFVTRGLSPQKNAKRNNYPAYSPMHIQKVENSPIQQSTMALPQRFSTIVSSIDANMSSMVQQTIQPALGNQANNLIQIDTPQGSNKRGRIGMTPAKRKLKVGTPPPVLVISSDEEEEAANSKEKSVKKSGARITFINEQKKASPISDTAIQIATRLPRDATTQNQSGNETALENLNYGLSLLDNPQKILDTLEEVLSDRPKKVRISLKSLYSHCKMGYLSKVLSFLLEDLSPVASLHSEEGKSPLHAAASKGHLDILIALVYKAAGNIDVMDNFKRTPLYVAVEKGHLEASQFLHRAGASLSCKNFDGMGLTHVAAHKGRVEILSWLLGLTKSMNEQDNGGWTSLMWAAEDGNADALILLIKKGARTDLRDKERNTVLHWASMAGSLLGCEVLLNAKCDVNSVNMYGDTPLHIAAREGNLDVVKLFLLRGADTSFRNKEEKLPMDVCVNSPQIRDIIRLRHAIGHVTIRRKYDSDISRGKERIPVSCINDVDDEALPLNFTYISESIESHTVNIMKDLLSVKGCDCKDDCALEMCECIQRNEDSKCWYEEEVLDMKFGDLDQPVLVECSKLCRCSSHCSNRLVQKGIQFPLEVYKTRNLGWGLRTICPIKKGSFVLSYAGEVISDEEADRRANDSYLFDLDMKNSNDEDNCLDANRYGNCGRFINHSCESNLLPVRVFTHHRDWRFPGIAFFASRDIAPHEALSFDYGDKFWEIKKKSGLRCQCISSNCKYTKS